jgi:hypothetical protein
MRARRRSSTISRRVPRVRTHRAYSQSATSAPVRREGRKATLGTAIGSFHGCERVVTFISPAGSRSVLGPGDGRAPQSSGAKSAPDGLLSGASARRDTTPGNDQRRKAVTNHSANVYSLTFGSMERYSQ